MRRSGALKFAARNSRRRCCSRFRWCWAARARGRRLRCGIPARTGAFRFRMADSTGPRSSAVITAGASTRAVGVAWRFHLTSQDKLKVERIFAGHFPCQERDGYVWVYMNAPGTRLPETIPPAPALATFSEKYKITHLSCELPSHIDHGIIGLMDPAHGPFVHQSWFWRSRHSIHDKEKRFEPIPCGFRMSPHSPSANSAPYQLLKKMTGEGVTTTIDFVLPNLRLEEIHSGRLWFSSRATVTPVRRNLCRIDFVAAWNVKLLPVPVFRMFGKTFLRQDQRTMVQQAEGLKHNPKLMLIDDADRPAKWYFALKANLLESRRTGEAMRHPMDGPVTLRWRS